MIYDKIIDNNFIDCIEDEQIDEVLSFLHLKDFSLKFLQEVILFDDAA